MTIAMVDVRCAHHNVIVGYAGVRDGVLTGALPACSECGDEPLVMRPKDIAKLKNGPVPRAIRGYRPRA